MNLLERLNREAKGQFDIATFRHEARWLGDRIEMHLVSQVAQAVMLNDQIISFEKGESIHTESCRKYTRASLAALAEAAGWRLDKALTDPQDRFMVAILKTG